MRLFEVPIDDLTIDLTADKDVASIIAHTNRSLIVVEMKLSTTVSESALKVRWRWITRTAAGSAGSAVTPLDVQQSGAAAGFTANLYETPPGSGTNTVRHADSDDIAVGLRYLPTPEPRIEVPGATRLCLNLPGEVGAPATLKFSGYIYLAEVG